MLDGSNQCEQIDQLAHQLKQVEARRCFGSAELELWTNLATFITPTRLSMSNTSNEEVFQAFEEHLRPCGRDGEPRNEWKDEKLAASVRLLYSISVQCTVGCSSRLGRIGSDNPLNDAINEDALRFIYRYVLSVDHFHSHTTSIDVLDCFLKYFIIHCQSKLQEMFSVCEEELAWMEALEEQEYEGIARMKEVPLNFKVFLNLIRIIYDSDGEQLVHLSKHFFIVEHDHLGNFLRSAMEITSPSLYVDYVLMLVALCKTRVAGSFIYRLFNNPRNPLYDWASLFGSLRQYVQIFQRHAAGVSATSVHSRLAVAQSMRDQERMGTMAWIRLAATVAKHDPDARRYLVVGNHFNALEILVSGVTSAMPTSLKGEIFKLLAVLATDESAATQIWALLIRERVCEFANATSSKLVGVQIELEEYECISHTYESTLGFLHLARSLFSRQHLPETRTLTAYIYFVSKSIVCQIDQREYEHMQQMWELLAVAIDALFQLLRRFHISPSTLVGRSPQVFLLSQLLGDSDLSRAILRALIACCSELNESIAVLGREAMSPKLNEMEARINAAKALLRLLAHVVSVHPTLRSSLRGCTETTPIFVERLDTVLLTPLPSAPQSNYVHLLHMFLDDRDVLLPHTYYVIRILRKLAVGTSGELHEALLRTFESNGAPMRAIFTNLTAVSEETVDLIVSDQDVVPFNLQGVSMARLRGEIAHELLELFIEVLEAAPNRANLTYLLFGFEGINTRISQQLAIDENSKESTCMQSLLMLMESLIASQDASNIHYAVLFEPALRLLAKLCRVDSLSSEPTLRYLRNSSNLIYRLTQSAIFQHDRSIISEAGRSAVACGSEAASETSAGQPDANEKTPVHTETFKRQIRALILELVAVDFSVAMSENHVQLPADYVRILLGPSKSIANPNGAATDAEAPTDRSQTVIWSLLFDSLSASLEIETPDYRSFDMARVEEALKACQRPDMSGVVLYDVEMVHFMLNEELSALLNADVQDVRREANEILLYCVQYNAQRRLEGSCVQVLSGWVAFINAMVFFAPLPFLDLANQQSFLNDALLVLKEYLETVTLNEDVLGGLSSCMFGLIRRLVQFACLRHETEYERKVALGTLMHVLVRCLTMPGYNRYTRFKMDIYGAMLCVMEACTRPTNDADRAAVERWNAAAGHSKARVALASTSASANDSALKPATLLDDSDLNGTASAATLEMLLNRRNEVRRNWSALFRNNATELLAACADDIEYAPFGHKLLAIACLGEIIREERHCESGAAATLMTQRLARIGLIKAILDSLPDVADVDFADAARDNVSAMIMLRIFLCLLMRLATSRGGYELLSGCNAFARILKLRVWREAPREVYDYTNTKVGLHDCGKIELAESYVETVDCLFKFCMAMLSTQHGRSCITEVLDCVNAHLELLNHLKRQTDNDADRHFLHKAAMSLVDRVEEIGKCHR